MSEPSYICIDIRLLKRAAKDIPFDVFLKVSESHYAHVFSKSTGLDYKRLAQYTQKGVKDAYILESDQEAFRAFVARTHDSVLLDPNVPKDKKIEALQNQTEQIMNEVFTHLKMSEETATQTKKVVQNYVKIMGESPTTLSIILKMVAHGDYLYAHSVTTAVFSMFIAKATGQFNRRMLELVGLGGFLHDIGCTQLSQEITESGQDLSPGQWKEMRTHPKLGLQMVESTQSIPDEVRYIIYQHHEEPGGNGYPNGLRGPVIFYPAKIVAAADAFSALITRRPYRPAYTVEQAVHILQSETGKYDPMIVQIVGAMFNQSSLKKSA
jgi:putative nucleotidyltransferase with HDIG domain